MFVMFPLSYVIASQTLPQNVVFLWKHLKQHCQKHPSYVWGTRLLGHPASRPVLAHLHFRAFLWYKQIANTLEQRSQTGDQMCFACMSDSYTFEPALTAGRFHAAFGHSDLSGDLATTCPCWVMAAAFRWAWDALFATTPPLPLFFKYLVYPIHLGSVSG